MQQLVIFSLYKISSQGKDNHDTFYYVPVLSTHSTKNKIRQFLKTLKLIFLIFFSRLKKYPLKLEKLPSFFTEITKYDSTAKVILIDFIIIIT